MNDYDFIIRAINYDDNKDELVGAVYRLYSDIAFVLCRDNLNDEVFVLRDMLIKKRILNVSEEEQENIWKKAFENTAKKYPVRVYTNMLEIITKAEPKDIFEEGFNENIHELEVPLITTTRRENGAIAIFYPHVMGKLGEMIGGSYYVNLTGTDQVRIHLADKITPERVLKILNDLNRTAPEYLITRKIYKYDIDKKTLEAVDI